MDFVKFLNESSSTKKKITGELVINTPTIDQTGQKLIISESVKLNSNCNTKIICESLEIKKPTVLTNLSIDGCVIITETNNVTISKCYINGKGEGSNSVYITDSQKVKFTDSDVTGQSKVGIYITSNSKVTIEGTQVHDLEETLIVLRNKSTLNIQKSKIFNSKANCFYVADNADIEISECSIFNAEYPCVCITSSKCIMRHNEFKNCKQNTVSICTSDNFLFENNVVSDGKSTGLSVEQSNGTISKNNFYNLYGNGVLCSTHSDTKIVDNNFLNNDYPSIVIQSKSKAKIWSNKISGNKINGISLRDAAEVFIEKTEIEDVDECGISISDTEKAVISNSSISDCRITGIESYNKSFVYVFNNKISSIGKHAFLAYTSGYIKAYENSISKIGLSMAKLVFKGTGEFTKNSVKDCQKQCECLTSSFFLFDKNSPYESLTNDPHKSNNSIKLVEKYVDVNNNNLCLKCKNKPHDCFILPCSHRVYCKECAEEALKNKEVCPLCRFPIENVSSGFNLSSDDTCIICMTNKKDDCIIMPCGHMGVCLSCLESWLEKSRSCPICRAEPCFYKKISNNDI